MAKSSGRDSDATTTKSSLESGAAETNTEPPAAAAVKPVKYCPPRPPRGFSATTDDRGAARCGPPCCVPDGCAKAEGHYACDRQAAKALAQYVTPDERAKVLRWLDALERLGGRGAAGARTAADEDAAAADEDVEQSERFMYLTCLLMLLRSGRLIAPFTRWPPAPPHPFRPLRDVVDRRLYKRVQVECRRRRLHERARYARPDVADAANRPSGFFDRMPEPCDGVLCYGAVFSDIPS